LFILLVPFPFEHVPKFEFLVVDENGQPLPGVTAVQEMRDYTYNKNERNEVRSDNLGQVVFPSRSIWASFAYMVGRPVLAQLLTLAHGSTGAQADMYVVTDSVYAPTNVARWRSGPESESQIPRTLTAIRK
jgi:hypothetical protein